MALARLVQEVGDELVVMADLCLDEFTDHGHCGVLVSEKVKLVLDVQLAKQA